MSSLFFIFIILPISLILLLIAGITNKKIFASLVLYLWLFIISMSILAEISRPLFAKKVLDRSDYYGEYIIDRDYFPGKQADWQYNNFRFKIKENDSIYFYVTNKDLILKTFKGKITTSHNYTSARLKLRIEEPSHHILTTNPTIYREVWSFFLVFNSPKFNNMYFRKGKWKKIN